MHTEIKAISDEKNYWEERLKRMSTQITEKKRFKQDLCNPLTRTKFNLFNKKNSIMKSKLISEGMLPYGELTDPLLQRRKLRNKMTSLQTTSRRDWETSNLYTDHAQTLSPSKSGNKNDIFHPFSQTQGRLGFTF